MSELDQALEAYLKDDAQQDAYYALVLANDLYVPLQADGSEATAETLESVRPLILESDAKHYMMLFDSAERLREWGKEELPYAVITGRLAAEISSPALHWAVNIGSGFAKEFVPEEIAYLKELASI